MAEINAGRKIHEIVTDANTAGVTTSRKQYVVYVTNASVQGSVPVGGTIDQVLAKASATNYDTEWVDQTGGGGAVDSVNGEIGVVVLDTDDVGEGLVNLYHTEARVDANTNVAANTAARHAESHTVVSHSDTTATGAELETLTNGSDADSLHIHPAGGAVASVHGRTDVVVGAAADYDGITLFQADSLHLDSGISIGTSIGPIRFGGATDEILEYNATDDMIQISSPRFRVNSRAVIVDSFIEFGDLQAPETDNPWLQYNSASDTFHFNRPIRVGPIPEPEPAHYQDVPFVCKGGPLLMEDADLHAEDVYVNYRNTAPGGYARIFFSDSLLNPEAGLLHYDPSAGQHNFIFNHGIYAADGFYTDYYLTSTGQFGGGGVIDAGVQLGVAGAGLLTFSDSPQLFNFNKDLNVQGDITATSFIGALNSANVYKIDGQGVYTEYTASADTNAARGVALQAALTAASSGDTLYVRAGVYDTHLLCKTGVTLYFEPGANVTYTGATAGAIFDDEGLAITMTVAGHGEFTYSGTATNKRVFNLTNGASAINLSCKSLTSNGVAVRFAGTGTGKTILRADSITSADGTIDNLSSAMIVEIFARLLTSSAGYVIEQDGGTTIVHGAELIADADSAVEYVSTSTIYLEDCRLKSGGGNTTVNATAAAAGEVTLVNCSFDSVHSIDVVGNASLQNCWNVDGTTVNVSGTKTFLGHEALVVVGPTSAVDSNIAAFDTTTGKLVKDSGVAYADITSNTTHRTSNGVDHTYINQDVTSGSSPTLDAANITGGRVGFTALNANTSCASGSWVKIAFTTEVEDTNAAWDGSRFTVPTGKGGIYLMTGLCTLNTLGDGKKMVVGVRVNGTLSFLLSRGVVGGTDIAGFGGSCRYELSAGDYIEMYVYHNHGSAVGTYSSSGYCHFSAYLESV